MSDITAEKLRGRPSVKITAAARLVADYDVDRLTRIEIGDFVSEAAAGKRETRGRKMVAAIAQLRPKKKCMQVCFWPIALPMRNRAKNGFRRYNLNLARTLAIWELLWKI